MKHHRLLRLLLVHITIVLLSPGIAALVVLGLTFDWRSPLHFGALLAVGFGIVFSYLFFGVQTLLFVILFSPILSGVARIKSRIVAIALAVLVGMGLGWSFNALFAPSKDRAQMVIGGVAAAITAVVSAVALQVGWRDYLSSPKGKFELPSQPRG